MASRNMSLSLNWKALSSRIGHKKPQEIKSKKLAKGHKYQAKDVSKLRKAQEIIRTASTKLLTPLEFALWARTSSSTFSVASSDAKIAVDYSDKKKSAPGKFLAIDCEFVGVGPNDQSALARVSLVNYYGVVLLDTYVKPEQRVTNWRTWVSGVTPQHMRNAVSYKEARERVKNIIDGRVLVGHAVHNDLECLGISVPKHLIRDTSRFPEFKKQNGGKMPSLKKLCRVYLNLEIQNGLHSSVEDAQATMAIFRLHQKAMESHFTS
ncbi:hypothetical protein METBIDRAFT_33705 [Metschnikowia bicuspidata var. bicuspidata NRRL YB-4993]|uniref:RNA exonuclease 4 n=1 Tax=Metschnikowia bicuspidata var. bicuspidata NRRL YB-4993 TaxID=869754 RepID=A0A1A0H5C2_9ASCO|nr:hypothetical protein METBIDRAFT_33705 [Metschnikowia bicuspidata var. bicuspidata NRRL YB-4993]OBA19107.1 hypothetical protein METBIDRAFT_33705 [Metschnikowia bicuspidata var. bicuspidata NRRL YB-4993]